jgi:PHD/YefM family antitoxin component YafN of YafNO toxin-antitoxin module
MAEIFNLHLPTILNSGQAKQGWTKVMNGATEHGETYVVTGTKGKAVVVMGRNQFEELRNSYVALAEELEARRALEDKGTKEAIERVSEVDLPHNKEEFVTASKVEDRELTEQR